MPELPEVDHARRRFLALAGEELVVDAEALDTIVVPGDHAAWRAALIGRRIEGARRHGKNVIVQLSGDHALWFHLGMTGLVASAPTGELPRFTRWWLRTARGRVALCDARKLGRCVVGTRAEIEARIASLGPDALTVGSVDALERVLAGARGPIKGALMDQERIAGLGNIHVGEALFLAKVHPETPVPSLRPAQLASLTDAIGESLRRAFASMEGEEELVYVEAGGPNPFLVYDREGEPCPVCGATIRRDVARGRASFTCPTCQRAPRARRAAE